MRNFIFMMIGSMLVLSFTASAAPGDPIFETCPEAEDVGDNVACYPVAFMSKTEVHPAGIPIIGYLFVPTNAPAGPLPAIVFAHGSGSMYSSGKHNKGLNSKHKQWVRQYTEELDYVSLHVSSFHSRYLLPSTPGDQRILDIDAIPAGLAGGDDYRATSSAGGLTAPGDDLSSIPAFDPDQEGWKDQSNGGAGVSEITERPFDLDAAWDFLAGIRKGVALTNARNEDSTDATLGSPMAGIGTIDEIVNGGVVVDHERIFLYGTSHGGQAAIGTSHAARALDSGNPMNTDLPGGFNLKRYAGFLDYYGGCGIYGALGGASAASEWRPYAPFLILTGNRDDTVFDDPAIPVDSLAELATEACGKRVAAAKADGSFNEFLEVIVYGDTFHSFDGVEESDVSLADPLAKGWVGDWLSKIHSNYRVSLKLLEAISRRVSDRRQSLSPVSDLEDFGYHMNHPFFTTVPMENKLPPAFRMTALPKNGINLKTGTVDLSPVAEDRFGLFDTDCSLNPVPSGVTVDNAACIATFAMTDAEIAATTWPFAASVAVGSDMGIVHIPVNLVITNAATNTMSIQRAGPELYNPTAFPTATDGSTLHTRLDGAGNFSLDLSAFVWTDHRSGNNYVVQFQPGGGIPAGFSVGGNRFLTGTTPAVDTDIPLVARAGFESLSFTLTLMPNGSQVLPVNCCKNVIVNARAATPTPALSPTNFATGFVALPPVSTESPVLPGEFPENTRPGNSDGDDGSGGEDPGDGGSGGGGSGNGGSGGGGGALFWLLPIALLMRKHN